MNKMNELEEKITRLLWLSEAGVSWSTTQSGFESLRKSIGWSSEQFYEFVCMIWFFDFIAVREV